jgi:hypothetical protein
LKPQVKKVIEDSKVKQDLQDRKVHKVIQEQLELQEP